ncbi:hypothetical protein ABDH89_09400 [Paenibacillus naphthalenovorans]
MRLFAGRAETFLLHQPELFFVPFELGGEFADLLRQFRILLLEFIQGGGIRSFAHATYFRGFPVRFLLGVVTIWRTSYHAIRPDGQMGLALAKRKAIEHQRSSRTEIVTALSLLAGH